MNFNEAVAEVIAMTSRPDKATAISSAINAVLSLCTMKASFARDLVETTIAVDPTLYGDTIQFNNALPTPLVTRFRKFKYVKASGVRNYLRQISPDQIFSPGNAIQRDIYYVGGDNFTYVLSDLTPTLEIGYYQYPEILTGTTGKNDHWMLELMPWTIIELAAARIFKSIGDDTSFRVYQATGDESFRINRADHEDSILAQAR